MKSLNRSECSNPELPYRAAAELAASHSHFCPVHEGYWGHHDPNGKCQNKRDRSDKPTKMVCPPCKDRKTIVTDEGRAIPVDQLQPYAYVYPNRIRIEWKRTTYSVSRLPELSKLREWLRNLNPYIFGGN